MLSTQTNYEKDCSFKKESFPIFFSFDYFQFNQKLQILLKFIYYLLKNRLKANFPLKIVVTKKFIQVV